MKLTSPAFNNNGDIPAKYTCDGDNINPPLLIEAPPPQTKSFTLIIDDPDAPHGVFTHWVLWNIPASVMEIREGAPPWEAAYGLNDFGKEEYGGPCPPSGRHRYMFKLYALDIELPFLSGAAKQDLETTMEGHILAQAVLVGLYSRA